MFLTSLGRGLSDPLALAKESYQLLSKNLNSLTRSQSRPQRLENNRRALFPYTLLNRDLPQTVFFNPRLEYSFTRSYLKGGYEKAATLLNFAFYFHHVKLNLLLGRTATRNRLRPSDCTRYLHYKLGTVHTETQIGQILSHNSNVTQLLRTSRSNLRRKVRCTHSF